MRPGGADRDPSVLTLLKRRRRSPKSSRAAAVGIPLYVCEGEEVPLTLGLLAAGFGPDPSLTFLLGSVGTCVPTLLMSRGILGERATAF